MNTLSKSRSGIDTQNAIPERVNYVFWGAVIGVLAGLASLFAVSTSYAAMTGLGGPVDCAVFGSITTLLLSQPVALVGIIVGAVCGGACAMIAHIAHGSRSSG